MVRDMERHVGGGETVASQESGDCVKLYQGIECDMCRKAGKKEWGVVIARDGENEGHCQEHVM